jgi:hypothetical protein
MPIYKTKDGKTELIDEETLKRDYPNTYQYLVKYKNQLINRKDSRKTVSENKGWYALIRKGRLDAFKSNKLVTPALTKHNSFALDIDGSAFLTGGAGVFALVQKELNEVYLLALLNSKLIEYFLHSISTRKQNGYYSYLHTFLSEIPIIKLEEYKQIPFIERGQKIAVNIKEIQLNINKFRSRILERFPIYSLLKKIDRFYELDFSTFINTIQERSSRKLSLKETDEWHDYFNSHKSSITKLIDDNRRLTEELDVMIFDLYGVTDHQRKSILELLES